jgi:putative spermidine/putrescine transport system permease protein
VVIVQISKSNAPESMAAALASLLFAGLLLAALSLLDRRRSTTPEGS